VNFTVGARGKGGRLFEASAVEELVAIGGYAGFAYTSSETNNIVIGNQGAMGESDTIRIGDGVTQTSA
jgi:hypothetical protein